MRKHLDRLSTLPDELLCHILSLLPSREAIRTSILSSRWTNIMAFVPVLNFECPAPTFSFINILDKLLSSSSSANLRKLRLHISDCHWSIVLLRVNYWVHSAINRNVVDLDIRVPDFATNAIENHKVLALHIIASDSLQILKISGGLGLHMPSTTGCFKNLKTFKVKLNDPDKELLAKLFCSLPQLEMLLVEGNFSTFVKMDMNICINIIVPALKWLSLRINQEDYHNVDFKVLIDAPMLENIFLGDDYLSSYSVKSSPFIVKATLDIRSDYYHADYISDHARFDRAIELIGGLSYAKSLSVIDGASAALDWASQDLPLLHGLTNLQLDDLCLTGLSLIPLFLESAPKLKKVVITIPNEINDIEGWYWNSPLTLPTSLSHLEEFEIKGAAMIAYEPSLNDMVDYIITNVKVLKKFKIDKIDWCSMVLSCYVEVLVGFLLQLELLPFVVGQ